MPHTLLYGGTFDPIHHGHLITAQRARELLAADRVLFLPAQISPHKLDRQSASPDHRLAMLHRAIADNPFFTADGRELLRPGPSYTFDTLATLRQDFPDDRFTLLIGADQLPRFHTWHRVRELLDGPDRIDIAILARPGALIEPSLEPIATHLGAPTADRFRSCLLATPLIEISATEIRARIAAALPIDFLLPTEVAAYIHEQGLYRNSP